MQLAIEADLLLVPNPPTHRSRTAGVGRQPGAAQLGEAGGGCIGAAALGDRAAARLVRPGARSQGGGLRLHPVHRPGRPAGARADRLHAGDGRALRLCRGLTAAAGEPASARAPASCPTRKGRCMPSSATSCTSIPTAEVPVTNLYRDEILAADRLPIYPRLHALLPPRGGCRRQGHAWPPARPPVRQGRDGQVRGP